MKNLGKLGVVLLAAGGLVNAGNALAASAEATATATVIEPIAIDTVMDLAFGSFAASATGGTVVVEADGSRNVNGVTAAGSEAYSAAAFDVTGQANATYAIGLPASAELSSGTDVMQITGFSSNLGAVGTLDAAGAQQLMVGGTLEVGANQAAGSYTGSFVVNVDYN